MIEIESKAKTESDFHPIQSNPIRYTTANIDADEPALKAITF